VQVFIAANLLVDILDILAQLILQNKNVMCCGIRLGKPVCATGDVHFLNPEDEVYRRVLLDAKGYEDADAPNPLYFRTTGEMLAEFSYLGKETARQVVIENTNLIADWCDMIKPLPDGLFAPKLENSDGELTNLVWSKVKELYGENFFRSGMEQIPPNALHNLGNKKFYQANDIIQVACGSHHTVMLDIDGKVWCYGNNKNINKLFTCTLDKNDGKPLLLEQVSQDSLLAKRHQNGKSDDDTDSDENDAFAEDIALSSFLTASSTPALAVSYA
jgi:hypothetical protein